MANVIFYFTGTGNSLAVARQIADEMGDTKLVSISDAIKASNVDLKFERIGFVFPVYFSRVPSIVKHFIAKLKFTKSEYLFAVITYAGVYGQALKQLHSCIAEQGGNLNAGFSVRMPGNYIVKYGAFPKLIQRLFFRGKKKKVKKVSTTLIEKETLIKGKKDFVPGIFEESINKTIKNFGNNAQNFYVNEKCNGCASCKMICPVSNIEMEEKQPKWGRICEQCMACIQWCPKQAIEYADKTKKRKRYQNPEIKISDFILRKS